VGDNPINSSLPSGLTADLASCTRSAVSVLKVLTVLPMLAVVDSFWKAFVLAIFSLFMINGEVDRERKREKSKAERCRDFKAAMEWSERCCASGESEVEVTDSRVQSGQGTYGSMVRPLLTEKKKRVWKETLFESVMATVILEASSTEVDILCKSRDSLNILESRLMLLLVFTLDKIDRQNAFNFTKSQAERQGDADIDAVGRNSRLSRRVLHTDEKDGQRT